MILRRETIGDKKGKGGECEVMKGDGEGKGAWGRGDRRGIKEKEAERRK